MKCLQNKRWFSEYVFHYLFFLFSVLLLSIFSPISKVYASYGEFTVTNQIMNVDTGEYSFDYSGWPGASKTGLTLAIDTIPTYTEINPAPTCTGTTSGHCSGTSTHWGNGIPDCNLPFFYFSMNDGSTPYASQEFGPVCIGSPTATPTPAPFPSLPPVNITGYSSWGGGGQQYHIDTIGFDGTTNTLGFTINPTVGYTVISGGAVVIAAANDVERAWGSDNFNTDCLTSGTCLGTKTYTPTSYTGNADYTHAIIGVHITTAPWVIWSDKTYDFSAYFATSTYSITGSVYNDDNQNGSQDTGESGVNGATVTLNTGQTATTDANGNYTFSNLPAGTYTETLTVPNGYSATTTNPATVSISANTTQNFGIYSAPVVSAITAPTSPAQVNTSVSTSATFTDGDTTDTHNNSGTYWDWGDTTTSQGTVTEPNGSTPGSVTGSHTYTSAGVYTVKLTVTDNDGASGSSTYQYVSIYNPTSQGLFSAGQHFSSSAGAYPANSSLTGTVKFGLSYKYQGTMPVGDKQFTMNFNAANLLFNATTISSLVISNSMATLTGTGTINNGSHTYNFLVVGVNGGNIRVQITDPSNNNAVVYDTQPGDPSTTTPTTSVNGQVIAHN